MSKKPLSRWFLRVLQSYYRTPVDGIIETLWPIIEVNRSGTIIFCNKNIESNKIKNVHNQIIHAENVTLLPKFLMKSF